MLQCTAYNEERSHSTQLQQPYIESEEDILGHFLFNTEDIEEKKELLFSICEASLQNAPYVAEIENA